MRMMPKVVALLLLVSVETVLGGSCAAEKKCCDGKDTDCAVSDYDPNSLRSSTCFCDHGCLDMGDCCPDFKDYCGVMDCVVSEWSEWSDCDSQCGRGVARRSREVVHPASNGGKECEALEQTRSCRGEGNCSRRNRGLVSAFTETAMLLPGKYSTKRTKTYDVRHNLKTYVEPDNKDQYCIVFRVDKAMKACLNHKDTVDLNRGNEVCVACESKAFRDHLGNRCTGHGVEGKRTRFKNVISPGCHGRWERVSLEESCPCKNGPHFIFV